MIYRLLREILSWESIEVSQKANGFIYSAKDRLKMIFITCLKSNIMPKCLWAAVELTGLSLK